MGTGRGHGDPAVAVALDEAAADEVGRDTVDRDPGGPEPTPLDERLPGARPAMAIAMAVAVVGYLLLTWDQWFYLDEWTFLTYRDGGDLDSVLRAHNEHLSAVPVVANRVLFNLFGLHTYRPYQALTLAAHLGVVAVLWGIVRRNGGSAWVATISASVLLFYGQGTQNATWGTNLGFTSGILGGLACLYVADTDDPSRPRIAGAIACGLVGVLASGTAVLVLAVGLFGLAVKRGPVRSIVIAAVTFLPYLWWWQEYQFAERNEESPTIRQMLSFVRHGQEAVVESVAYRPVAGLIVVLAVAAGLVLAAIRADGLAGLRTRLAVPVTLLAGGAAFLLVTSRGRAVGWGVEYAAAGRFRYTVLALSVPAIALALSELARRWPAVGVVFAGVLVLAMPLNLLTADVTRQRAVTPGTVYLLATDPDVQAEDPSIEPFADLDASNTITLGWLAQTRDEGRIPDDVTVTDVDRAEVYGRALIRREPLVQQPPDCRSLAPGDRVPLDATDGALATFGEIHFEAELPNGASSYGIRTGSMRLVEWSGVRDEQVTIELARVEPPATAYWCPSP